jgi:hypothetical protein
VDRSVLDLRDQDMVKSGKLDKVLEKHKNKILKDNDFELLGFKFKVSKLEFEFLYKNISSDAEFLKFYHLTDYSILLSIHRFNQEDFDKCDRNQNYRILKSTDNKYLYNFSIIDFLTVFLSY